MKNLKATHFLILFNLLLLGCKQKVEQNSNTPEMEIEAPISEKVKKEVLSVDSYIKWIRNPQNGFQKIKIIDDIRFTVLYKPYEYIVCMEERSEKIADSTITGKIKELAGTQYYDLKISLKNNEGELLKVGLSNANEYEQRVKYFAFEMQKDIHLVDGKDTLSCTLYHFERVYASAPFCTILLGFDKSVRNAGNAKTLLVYDKTFNKGLLKFSFKENRLQTLPKLLTL